MAESLDPEVSISAVARRHGLNPNQLFTWRRRFRDDGASRPWALPFEGCVEARQDPEAASDRCSIEIVIGGMTVRVGTDVDEGALRRVLSVVRSLP